MVAIAFGLYYSTKKQKLQILILIIASFIFYAWNFPALLLLLLLSIAINAISSYGITTTGDKNLRKIYATLGVVLNLAILGFFKYSPLIGHTFFEDKSTIGQFLVSIPLPIGISFFTFQGISLVIDTFTGKELVLTESHGNKFSTHLAKVTLFKAFFPQLVAGPIVKAHEFLPQIKSKFLSNIEWEFCFRNLVAGYFLKMVVADNLKEQTYWITYPWFSNVSLSGLLTLLFGYSMQIFADFAGYSLIAIGLAALFGYRLMDNFLFPYISTSFSEFWRRWHISLSNFLKEYLYIPLGGNRKGRVRTYINLMITMMLGGLWHGAAWSYAVWGTYHGALLASERFLKESFNPKPLNLPKNVILIIKGILVFTAVSFGWLLFKLPNFDHVIKYLQAMIHNVFFLNQDIDIMFFVAIYSLPVVIYHFLYLYKEGKNSSGYKSLQRLEPIIYGTMLFMLISNSGSSGDFIYFQF
ncbi:hypothetical protein NDI53_04070 [Leptolyngbya sp. NM3-A1]|nr:MBOAT family protein [Leptolyngbya sp. FACHB-16]